MDEVKDCAERSVDVGDKDNRELLFDEAGPDGSAVEDSIAQEASESPTSSDQDIIKELEAEVARLKIELSAKSEMAEEYLSHLQRLQADFENFKRRTRTEREKYAEYVVQDFVTKLLPVLDAFDLAEKALEAGGTVEALSQGVSLVQKQLVEVLNAQGLTKIEACQGENFDPEIHEALERVKVDDQEDGTIVEQLRPGYRLRSTVIRPAMVKVAERALPEDNNNCEGRED